VTLDAARGNPEVRERLRLLVADPERVEPIVLELGRRHALVRELFTIAASRETSEGAAGPA